MEERVKWGGIGNYRKYSDSIGLSFVGNLEEGTKRRAEVLNILK